MSIREVLVATDFSEIADEAVRAARQHAERFGARLHLLHVLETGSDDAAERLARSSEGLGATVPVLGEGAGGRSGERDRSLRPRARRRPDRGRHAWSHGHEPRVARERGGARDPYRSLSRARGAPRREPITTGRPAIPSARAFRAAWSVANLPRTSSASPCRARIRGEALRGKQEDERAGRTPR